MISPEDFYRQRLGLPTDAEKQGWVNKDFQQLGFKTIIDLVERRVPLTGLSVHDAGCGFGDIVPALAERGIAGYIGTDILPEMISGAMVRRPHFAFRRIDLRRDPLPVVDVTLICGTLAFHKPEDTEAILEGLWRSSRRCLAFMSWWNVPKELDPEGLVRRSQKVVSSFLLRSTKNRLARIEDYGVPHEAIFALFRD